MRESLTFADEVAASRTYLLRFARLQLRNDVWAEDLVAEIQLAALEKQHNFGGRSSLWTWLVVILKFKVIDCVGPTGARLHRPSIAAPARILKTCNSRLAVVTAMMFVTGRAPNKC